MKGLIISSIVVLATSTQLYAQSKRSSTASTSTAAMPSFITGASSVSGVQLELTKPILDMKLSGRNSSIKEDMESVYGLGLGYKNISVGQLGFIGAATFITGKVEDISGSFNFLRIDGNAAVGVNELIHLKGGINISQLMSAPYDVDDVIDKPGIGFQFGAGLQMSQNIALDLKYISMKQEGKLDNVSIDLEEKGLEFGISATF